MATERITLQTTPLQISQTSELRYQTPCTYSDSTHLLLYFVTYYKAKWPHIDIVLSTRLKSAKALHLNGTNISKPPTLLSLNQITYNSLSPLLLCFHMHRSSAVGVSRVLIYYFLSAFLAFWPPSRLLMLALVFASLAL